MTSCRRVRSANDAERLLDIPVIASLSATEKSPMLAEDVRVLMKRSGLSSLAVVGATEADGAGNVAAMLEGVQVSGAFDLSGGDFDSVERYCSFRKKNSYL